MGSNFIENSISDLDSVFQAYRGIQPYTDTSFTVNCGRQINFEVNNTSTDLRYRYEPIYTSAMLSPMNRNGVVVSVVQGTAGTTNFVVSGAGDLNGIFATSTSYRANVTVSATTQSLNLLTYLTSGHCNLNLAFFDIITVTIASGVTIYGASTWETPTPSLETGSGIPGLIIINNGTIYGAGGQGGGGGPASATSYGNAPKAGNGGDAISVQQACTIYNYGTIYGGGGGGGGGGSYIANTSDITDTGYGGPGGGGGEGYLGSPGLAGAGGASTTYGTVTNGTAGTSSAVGQPGTSTQTNTGKAGKGGTWGNPGVAGTSGNTNNGGSTAGYAGGAPGLGGYSVRYNGNSVSFSNSGSLIGSYG